MDEWRACEEALGVAARDAGWWEAWRWVARSSGGAMERGLVTWMEIA